jgi:hypothetical protein
MKWLQFIFELTPKCQLIDILEEWLTGLVISTSNTLDDHAVFIITSMLRKAFNCEKGQSDEIQSVGKKST